MPDITQLTGFYGAVLNILIDELKQISSFQTFVGVTDEAAAEAKIYYEVSEYPDETALAVIGYQEETGIEMQHIALGGGLAGFNVNRPVYIRLHRQFDPQDEINEYRSFVNEAGPVISDLATVLNDERPLEFSSLKIPPVWREEHRDIPYLNMELLLEVGL